MKPTLTRLLVLTVLIAWAAALSVPAISMNASAASLSGTWVSRTPGEGYTQSYIGPYGTLVTDEFDVELELSESSGVVTGTLRTWQDGGVQEFTVMGTVSDSVFYMTVHFGWDGVSYLTPVYTLTTEGDQMSGSGSYVNVGVTITGTFDLEKEGGLLGVDLGLGFLVEYNDYITVVVIVVAVTGMAVGSLPVVSRGLKLPPLEPSRVGETQPGVMGVPEAGRPVGGIGLHTPSQGPAMVRRQMALEEKDLAVKSVSGMRSAVQGLGFASIFVAAFSMYWPNGLFSLITVSVSLTVVIMMAQYLQRRSALKAALVEGTVVDVRALPVRVSGPKGWAIGPVRMPSGQRIDQRIVEGRPVTIACMPRTKLVLSVDGTLLGGAIQVTVPANAWDSARPAMHSSAPEEDLPPPPAD